MTDIRFGLTAIRNVGANVVDAIVARPRGEGPLRVLRGLPAQGAGRRLQQADHRVADQGRRVRLPRPDPARRCVAGPRGARSTPWSATSGRRPSGQDSTSSAASATGTTAAAAVAWCRRAAGGRVGQADAARLEREMLGLYVSDHPLFGVEHILSRAADCSIAALTGDEGRPDGAHGDDRGDDQLAAAQADQERQPVGDRHGRGPRRRHRGAVLPADLPDRLARPRRGPRRRRQGPGEPAGRRPDDLRTGAVACRTSTRATAARSSCRCR